MSLCNKSTSVIRKLLKLENDEILETLNKKKEVKNNNKKLVLFHKIDKQSNLLNNLKIKIIKKLYFFRVKSNSLFTINGADGAGKSSILNQISKIVEYYPFEVELIHHNKGGVKKSRPIEQNNKSLFRKICHIFI